MASGQDLFSTPSSCDRCKSFASDPEFGHTCCRRHRSCFGELNYLPSQCSICIHNKERFTHSSEGFDLSGWKKVLRATQKNLSGSWSYDQVNIFFDSAVLSTAYSPRPSPINRLSPHTGISTGDLQIQQPSIQSNDGCDHVKQLYAMMANLTDSFASLKKRLLTGCNH